jgi:hypothetical protein
MALVIIAHDMMILHEVLLPMVSKHMAMINEAGVKQAKRISPLVTIKGKKSTFLFLSLY